MAVLDPETGSKPHIRVAPGRRRRFKVTVGRLEAEAAVHRNLSASMARSVVDSMLNVMMGGGDAAHEILFVRCEPELDD